MVWFSLDFLWSGAWMTYHHKTIFFILSPHTKYKNNITRNDFYELWSDLWVFMHFYCYLWRMDDIFTVWYNTKTMTAFESTQNNTIMSPLSSLRIKNHPIWGYLWCVWLYVFHVSDAWMTFLSIILQQTILIFDLSQKQHNWTVQQLPKWLKRSHFEDIYAVIPRVYFFDLTHGWHFIVWFINNTFSYPYPPKTTQYDLRFVPEIIKIVIFEGIYDVSDCDFLHIWLMDDIFWVFPPLIKHIKLPHFPSFFMFLSFFIPEIWWHLIHKM